MDTKRSGGVKGFEKRLKSQVKSQLKVKVKVKRQREKMKGAENKEEESGDLEEEKEKESEGEGGSESESEGGENREKGVSARFVAQVLKTFTRATGASGNLPECSICLEAIRGPLVTPCCHSFCHGCLLRALNGDTKGNCPLCRSPVDLKDVITVPQHSRFRTDTWESSSKLEALLEKLQEIRDGKEGGLEGETGGEGGSEGGGKEKEMEGGEIGDGPKNGERKESREKKKRFRPEKSVVFSQWTAFLDLVEVPLRK